jgi:hypothetical protein
MRAQREANNKRTAYEWMRRQMRARLIPALTLLVEYELVGQSASRLPPRQPET